MPLMSWASDGVSPSIFYILSSKSLHFYIAHSSYTASLLSLLTKGLKFLDIMLAMLVI